MSPLEEQACGVLTPFCFEKFQEEFGRATLYSSVYEHGCEFGVKHHDSTRSKTHIAFWDVETTTCSCKHFEFCEEGTPRLDIEILVDKPIGDVQCPSISITKGCPKTKQLKGGKETGKVTKSCGWCKKVGHNITTCPEKENIEYANESEKKKKKISSSDIGLNPVFCLKY
ncbi:hypothetical protein RHGRI_015129 [Rhododendron griersonianum]|uniref:Uncharacterized protein n=1 Tax=Rhododendron griersonianum TaxID=479676 RepID=A0AAV6KC51_9ERIC|nr:hypothetical protein RHGRI_015129 [Rhododendron griersonianum]